MSIFLLLSGILFTVYMIIGFHVLSLDKKSITHRLFFVICIYLSFLGLDDFFMLSAQTKSEFLIGYTLAILPFYFFFPFVLHFSLYLTSYIKKIKFLVFLIYLPAIPFFINTLLGGKVLFSDFVKEDGVLLVLCDM